MFLREQVVRKGERTYTYLKIVENAWQRGKVVQRTLVNLGNVAAWPQGKLQEVVRLLSRFLGMEPLNAEPNVGQVRFSDCRQLGPYLALSAIWSQLGMDAIIGTALSPRKLQIPVADYARAMVLHRLVDPCSKKAVHEALAQQIQMPGLNADALPLHGYYRALGYLSEAKTHIEKAVHLRIEHLFNRDLSLVFYDLTSTYFEGEGCSQARHGYSRDHRPDCVQIEIGLLVDADGVPIGHEVFNGNLTDVSTVLGTLKRLKADFGVQRCVFVGDDGMASEENLAQVGQQGYEYITSLSLRHSLLAEQMLAVLPPRRAFMPVKENLFVRALRRDGSVRYIGSYNPERARASRRHRKEHLRACIDYLNKLQTPRKGRGGRRPSPQEAERWAVRFVANKRCKDLIQVGRDESAAPASGQLWWKMDRRAWRLERARDGLMILKTNSATLTDREVASGYRMLWRVENAFRHIKDPIRLRPIRHWNDARVLGHVFVCVLAYMLERLIEIRLERSGLELSAAVALDKLRMITVATLTLDGQQIRRRSEITPEQAKVLAAVGVTNVPEVW